MSNYLLFNDRTVIFNRFKVNNFKNRNNLNLKFNDIPDWFDSIDKLKSLEDQINGNFINIELMYKEIKKLKKIDNVMYNMEDSLCRLIEDTERKIKEKDAIFKQLNYRRLEFGPKEEKIIGNILTKNNLESNAIQEKLYKLGNYLNDILSKYDNPEDNNENNNNNLESETYELQLKKEKRLNKRKRIEKIYNDTTKIMQMIQNIEEMVYLQGEHIDRIDINIGQATSHLKMANNNLLEIHKQYRNWAYRVLLFLWLSILICCILIVIKFS